MTSSQPGIRARIAVAILIATAAAPLAWFEPSRPGGDPGDLQQVWMGAVALLEGLDPYQVIGPEQPFRHDFEFLYPLPASLIIIPLAFLQELPAAVVFVWITTALLAFAVTADGWQRLPLFLSAAFVISVRRVQWAPLLTAAMHLPSLAWVFVAKPNIGLALLLAFRSRTTVIVAVAGGLVLTAVSLLILPRWPVEWLDAIGTARHTAAPLAQPGGFLVLLALLRWRRWEARLIVALACVPQSLFWYDTLPLLLVARTFRESLILSLVSSLGFVLDLLFLQDLEAREYYERFGALLIAVAYMPATLLVLLRPNAGAVLPLLERWISRASRRARLPERG